MESTISSLKDEIKNLKQQLEDLNSTNTISEVITIIIS